AGDLGGGEPADRAEGERDLGLLAQNRVAAKEKQGQMVVLGGRCGGVFGCAQQGVGLPAPAGGVAAPLVDESPGGDGDQPASGIGGNPVGRPLDRGGQQRLLDGVLGGVELPVPPHQRAEDLGGQGPQQRFEGRI